MFGVDVGNSRAKIRGGWKALCPVHGDTTASMTIKEGKRCVLIGCLSHNCDLRDICNAVGITVKSLWYDAESKVDAKAYADMQRKRREQEVEDAKLKAAIKHWSREATRWEGIAAFMFTRMMQMGRTPEALRAANLWHIVLHVARMHRERLWRLQQPSGTARHKFGEVDCYIISEKTEAW